jgi:hypothetical protein
VLASVLAGGCAKTKAAEIVAGPPLAMPAPPARVVAPAEPEPLTAAPGRAETPLMTGPAILQPSPPARRAPVVPARQDPVASAAPSPAPAVDPLREIRTESTAEETALRRETEILLASTASALDRVSRQSLSVLHRQQYDDSKSLSEVARKALTERNFVFALTNARKAAQLADALGGR